jgi:hypothetical protein
MLSFLIQVAEITAASEQGIAAALKYCQKRVVVPYLRLLASIGLRPLSPTGYRYCWVAAGFSCLHLLLMVCLLVLGYSLQFLSCFRQVI